MSMIVEAKPQTKRQRYNALRSQLVQERASFESHWKDLSDWILPRRSRWYTSDANKGDRRNSKIIDSTATLAARTLASGMMAGVTSPARPWFRLTTPDPDLAEFGAVKIWLHTVSQRMATVFLRSNIYNALPIIYGDIGVFGTAAMAIEEDFDNVIRCYPFPIGSYWIANNDRLKVDVIYREFQMTVRQLVQKFGRKTPGGEPDWSIFSNRVKTAYDSGNYEMWIEVAHVIRPNEDYDPSKLDAKFKRYTSCYFETGISVNSGQGALTDGVDADRYLRESGFDFFPVLCPRWEATGEDVYGTNCPGMVALGDIKQLQIGEKRILQAVEKMINPPITGPSALRKAKTSILPGDLTYSDEREGIKGLRPIHEIDPRIQEMQMKQDQTTQRIRRVFYEDLFLMLATSDRREITAREIDERREEKLLALGPVLEQLNQDLLDPVIDNTFEIMLRQGLIPEPPEELQEVNLKVEYISVMAQAQKLVGISGLERFMGFSLNMVAQTKDITILDKVDMDQAIDEYGEMTSVPPRVVRPDEEVAAIREQRAKAQQQQAALANVREVTGAAKELSQTDMGGDNALTRMTKDANAGNLVPAK